MKSGYTVEKPFSVGPPSKQAGYGGRWHFQTIPSCPGCQGSQLRRMECAFLGTYSMKRGAPDHWKMKELARLCGVPEPYALPWANGIMERLWHYTARFHPQGDIGTSPDWVICDACCWETRKRKDRPGQSAEKQERFIRALVDSRWLDENGIETIEEQEPSGNRAATERQGNAA